MGQIRQFPGNRRRVLTGAERALLDRLTGSPQLMWRGGWAEAGDTGLVLLRNRHAVGLWVAEQNSYYWIPIATGERTFTATTLQAAYELSLQVLGPLPEERFCEALDQYDAGGGSAHRRAALLEVVIRTSRTVRGLDAPLPWDKRAILERIIERYHPLAAPNTYSVESYADAAAAIRGLFF